MGCNEPTPATEGKNINMQINPNSSAGAVNKVESPAPSVKRVASQSDSDSAVFSQAEALNQALSDQSDVRAAAIEKAVNLIGQVKWPPTEVIRRISSLLAVNIHQNPE